MSNPKTRKLKLKFGIEMPLGITRHCGVTMTLPASAGLPMMVTKLYQDAYKIAGDELEGNYPSLLVAPFLRTARDVAEDGLDLLIQKIITKHPGFYELYSQQFGNIDIAAANRAAFGAIDYLEPNCESLWSDKKVQNVMVGACCTHYLMNNLPISLLNENIIDIDEVFKNCPSYSDEGIERSLAALKLVQMMVLLAEVKESGE